MRIFIYKKKDAILLKQKIIFLKKIIFCELCYTKNCINLTINFILYNKDKKIKRMCNSNSVAQHNTTPFIEHLVEMLPNMITHCIVTKHETTLYIHPEFNVDFLLFLKNHVYTQFKMLIDLTAVDYPSRINRFEVVYNLLSIRNNARIRIKTCLDEVSSCLSVCCLYSSAGWWERETWDMFGIFFSNHPDLRRILTDYGFMFHPLRKDFPLSGFVEVRYDDSEKRVITEPVEVTQEFRLFDFNSPWEQIEKI